MPQFSETTLYKGNFGGLCLPKTVPQLCPNSAPFKKTGNSFCVYANGRLRIRKRLFGLTQTVVVKARSPCYNGTCTAFGRSLLPIRDYLNEAKELSEWSKEGISRTFMLSYAFFLLKNLHFECFFCTFVVNNKHT